MPNFDFVRKTESERTFRVASVMSQFDLSSEKIAEKFSGTIDIENRDWNIGVIYGASGTGKSSVIKELWPNEYIDHFSWKKKSILDDMPKAKGVKEITQAFNAVGFSSPPSWLKPYSVLSTGEKMRVDLARAILEDRGLIVFDEFTSVVNRQVAKIGSMALAKAIRRAGKKFIAATCHYDILEWLEPDWAFCTDTMSFFLPRDTSAQKSNSRSANADERYGKCLGNITI
jgi:ABC-type transporter Mla maintaining outer membrane lipid asymmetry ATPase subunit MlaF